MMKYWILTALLLRALFCIAQVSNSLSVGQALQMAETNYPLLKAKRTIIEASQKAVEVSQNTKIPSLDASYQIDYATHNNISGMAYPPFLMPISGPPSSNNNLSGVFGSAASLLLNWQPITFGQREAQIAYSQMGVQYAKADVENEVLRHKVKVANAYLDVLTYEELLKIYQENVARTSSNLNTIKTLVTNGIKAGNDTTIFSIELSKAKIDLLAAQRNRAQSLITLSQLLASTENITVSDSMFFTKLPRNILVDKSIKNPLLLLQNTMLELDKSKRRMIEKSTAPTLGVWATSYMRGSGASYNGEENVFNGLGLQRFNYGVGLQLSAPLLQSLKIKPQLQQQDLLIKANEQKLDDITLQLNKQFEEANLGMEYALKTVKEMPLLVESSTLAYNATLSRYNAGLVNYVELVQTQYNLLKAQIDYKMTYMSAWKMLLYEAAIKGDIDLFLNQVN